MYPLNDPHGRVDSGMMSLSRYQVSSSLRRSLPISTHWLNKLFDLDRCIHILRLKIEEKELVLINVHLSAYDKGGVYRKQQINLLNTILEDEQEKGNYVIVGGDFNHDIADSASAFKTNQQQPDWLSFLSNSDLPNGYQFATTKEVPTCQGADVVYEKIKPIPSWWTDSSYPTILKSLNRKTFKRISLIPITTQPFGIPFPIKKKRPSFRIRIGRFFFYFSFPLPVCR